MIAIKNAIANIKAYKLRVAVAMIWIILGITAVIVVASVGKGIEAQMEALSTKQDDRKATIIFEPIDWQVTDIGLVLQPFTQSDMERVMMISGVQSVAPSTGEGMNQGGFGTEIKIGSKTTQITIEDYDEKKRPEILYGRDFSYDDYDRKVMLLSEQNAMELYDDLELALGEALDFEGSIYEVIGITAMPVSESRFDYSYPISYLAPKAYNDLFSSFGPQSQGVDKIDIKVSPGYNKNEVVQNVISDLQSNRAEEDGTYMIPWGEGNMAEEMQYMKDNLTKATSIITLISLIVGGVGIMNVMYMSVIERRREIGIRRAIGAKPKNILFQFITESIVITFIGGILGIIVGLIACVYLKDRLPFDIIIDYNACFYGSGISILIGVVFGIIPSFKASRLDPIKAIQGLK